MSSIDQIRARLGWGASQSSDHPVIEVLTPGDLRELRLPWLSRFSAATLARHIESYPGMALWVPETGEYVVAEPWRNRAEIASIIEVTARKGKAALIQSALMRLAGSGHSLALLSTEIWRDQTKLYTDLGFERVETIVFFELPFKREPGGGVILPLDESRLPRLDYAPAEPALLDILLQVDHDSFPWLWWNSRSEFEHYLQMPGVEAYIASYAGQAVGYASFTLYQGWAHLDRLAVITGAQGRKFGAAQLAYSLQLMAQKGANSVALSTQADNFQSHRLYKGFGFHQTSENLSFYGRWLKVGN